MTWTVSLCRRALLRAPVTVAVTCFILSGCATAPAGGTASDLATSPPAPKYNLSGYSTAFKQGYMDACTSPRRRDLERFKSDSDYSMGWGDGESLCRK